MVEEVEVGREEAKVGVEENQVKEELAQVRGKLEGSSNRKAEVICQWGLKRGQLQKPRMKEL